MNESGVGEKIVEAPTGIHRLILYSDAEGEISVSVEPHYTDNVEKDISKIQEDITDIDRSVKELQEEPYYSSSLLLEGTGTSSFNEIMSRNVYIKKGTGIRLVYSADSPGKSRLYANKIGTPPILAVDDATMQDRIIIKADEDITRLILYSDVTGKVSVSVSPDYTSQIEDAMDILNDMVGLDRTNNINTKSIPHNGKGLNQVYSFRTSYENETIYMKLSNFSDLSNVSRCLVYIGKGGVHGREELKKDDTGFAKEFAYDVPAGTDIIVWLVDSAQGTFDASITETLKASQDSMAKRLDRVESDLGDFEDRLSALEDVDESSGNSPYKGMTGICMGDSHASNRDKWVKRLFDGIGVFYDAETTSVVVGKANEAVEGYEPYGDVFYAQAVRAVEQYSAGKKIDIAIVENVHYSINHDRINEAFPLKVKAIVDLGDQDINIKAADTWFNENIATNLPDKKLGTMFYARFKNTNYTLTFSGTLSPGDIKLILDGQDFTATVEEGDTIDEVVNKLGIWSFDDYTDWKNTVKGNVITIEYTGTETTIPDPVISFEPGSTGISMQQGTIDSYSSYNRYYQSYDLANWNNPSYWKRVSGWYGYSGLKGFYETLLEGIPGITIICCAFPCYGLKKEQFSTGLGQDLQKFYDSDFYKNNRIRATAFMRAGEYYNVKVIDVEKLCNITLNNWFEFNPEGDVHPNAVGYDRWADTIIKELL